MNRGRGITSLKYKHGGLSDAPAYVRREGLTWKLGEKTRTETALGEWVGQRAQAGCRRMGSEERQVRVRLQAIVAT